MMCNKAICYKKDCYSPWMYFEGGKDPGRQFHLLAVKYTALFSALSPFWNDQMAFHEPFSKFEMICNTISR